MELEQEILSKLVIHNKYARYLEDKKRRETWDEIVDRNIDMHVEKFPEQESLIREAFESVRQKKVLPSMRSAQFAGKPIQQNPSRIFNCSFVPIDSLEAFSEVMFLLLGGTGVGYSVQYNHVSQIPPIIRSLKEQRYLISDDIIGWADAIKELMRAYLDPTKTTMPVFDYSDIRPKGSRLVTAGGKAPGPKPLRDCIQAIKEILETKENGDHLSTLEVHDIICHIADAVLAGGIRRAALICLFSFDDHDMRKCKSGEWWVDNPQRGRANNSAVAIRSRITKTDFEDLWSDIRDSGSGEPGIFFSNDKAWGTNPSLRKGTKILTSNGIYPIEKLEDKTFKVKNQKNEWAKATCFLSGKNKPLYKITLQGGHEYYCTPEHEWSVKINNTYVKKETTDLKSGDTLPRIQHNSLPEGKKGTYEDGFFIGWHLGDGWTTKRSDTGELQHGLIVSKKEQEILDILKEYLEKLNLSTKFSDRGSNFEYNRVSKEWNKIQDKFKYSTKDKGLPKTIWSEVTEKFRKGIIDGLFSSDGHISKRKRGRITFTSSNKKLAKDVSELLGFYGIKNTLRESVSKLNGKNHERYDIRISGQENVIHFRNLFELSVKHKQEKLDSYEWKTNPSEPTIKIKSIEKTDLKEDVWDVSVYDETHTFQIPYSITGNCVEASLRPNTFCNLCDINGSNVKDQEDFEERVWAAAVIGTLQATYTDFHYLRPIWKENTEKDALLGIGITGIGSGALDDIDLKKGAEYAKEVNANISSLLDINKAARVTVVKPSGTSSLVLGTSSGIHPWHDRYYIRRLQLPKDDTLYKYLEAKIPELVKDYEHLDNTAVAEIPLRAPQDAHLREESALALLERVKRFNLEWVRGGHRRGMNEHNVSATISIKDGEWTHVRDWMWENRDTFNGLSILPFDGGTYEQAPFEGIDLSTYEEMKQYLRDIDLTEIREDADYTKLKQELACGADGCVVTSL